MDKKRIKVLLIEDNPGDVRLIQDMFKEADTAQFELDSVNRLSTGLEYLTEGGFDVILLDLGLPDSQGLDTLNIIRTQVPGLPIIVLTGLTDEEIGIKAVKEGAQDYLVKGQADSNLLIHSIHYAIERKNMEKELRRAGEEWQCILDSVSDGISIHDVDGNILRANKVLGELFGARPEELIGKKCYQVFHNREEPIEECPMLKSMLSRRNEYYELFEPYLNLWLSISCLPLFYEKGEVREVVHVVRDITERKNAEGFLIDSEKRYRAVAELANDAIICLEEPGIIYLWNKTAEKMFGYSAGEAIGKDLHKLIIPEKYREKAYDGLKAFFQIGTGPFVGKTIELFALHRNGTEFPVELSISAMKIKGKWQTTGIVRDITGRKRLEEKLTGTTATIVRAKKELETTFDAISDPLFIHDKEFRIVRANRAYAGAAGLPFTEIVGRCYYEIFPRMAGPFSMCIKEQELKEEEISLASINRIFHVRSYPIRDADGNYIYSVHIMEDITEAKRAQERIKQEMGITSHLLAIAEATAHTIDIDKLMEQVVHCCHSLMKSDICLSYLWNKEERVFQPSQAIGLAHEQIPLFRTESLREDIWFIKQAIERKGAIIVSAPFTKIDHENRESLADEPFKWTESINTIIIVPLMGRTEHSGLLLAIYRDKKELTERDLKIIRGMSHQVSSALEEARLYKESTDRAMALSRKIETIQVIHEIDRNILSTLNPQEILETTVNMIARLIPCERATIVLVDKEKEVFIYAAGFGVTFVPKGAFVPFSKTNATAVIKTGRSQYVANLMEVKNLLPLEKKFLEEGFLSQLRVPLVVKGEVIGLLNIGAKRPSAFTSEDLSTLEKLASQISIALENARLLKNLEDLFIATVRTLSNAIDAKSHWTRGHSERVTKIALDLGKAMGFVEKKLKNLELAGLLHDIGKLGTYETILNKPGRLSEEEINIIRQHPVKGAEILAPIRQLKDIIPAIKHHHEWYNGGGYPEGLKGEEIPLMARILTIADTVDAMGADRPYRKGKSMGEIIAELQRCSGTQFDPIIVDIFLKTLQKAA